MKAIKHSKMPQEHPHNKYMEVVATVKQPAMLATHPLPAAPEVIPPPSTIDVVGCAVDVTVLTTPAESVTMNVINWLDMAIRGNRVGLASKGE